MGIIQKESIKTTIVEGIGIFVGFFSMLFIYPLSDEMFGLIQFLFSSGTLLVPFLSLGLSNVVIRFFPEIATGKRIDFLNFTIFFSLIPTVLFALLFLVSSQGFYYLLNQLNMDTSLFKTYQYYILGIGLLLVQINIIVSFYSNYGKIAVTSMIRDMGYKLCFPIIVLLYYFDKTSLQFAPVLLLFVFVLILLALVIYGISNKLIHFRFKLNFKEFSRIKGLFSFMLFSSLTTLGNFLAFRIDLIMIAALLSLELNGLYAKILIITNVLDIPTRVLNKTAGPIISKNWNNKDVEGIGSIYKASSRNMFIVGIYLSIVLWFCLDDIFMLSSNPQSFENGKILFGILAIGKLFDLLTSINNSIIVYSPSYRINLLFILILGSVNIILNYFFISTYGIFGAAYATLGALLVFNIIKTGFIFLKYKIHPISSSIFKTLAIASVVFLVLIFIPNVNNSILNILVKSTIISSLFIFSILYFKVSEEINLLYKYWFNRIKLIVAKK